MTYPDELISVLSIIMQPIICAEKCLDEPNTGSKVEVVIMK